MSTIVTLYLSAPDTALHEHVSSEHEMLTLLTSLGGTHTNSDVGVALGCGVGVGVFVGVGVDDGVTPGGNVGVGPVGVGVRVGDGVFVGVDEGLTRGVGVVHTGFALSSHMPFSLQING